MRDVQDRWQNSKQRKKDGEINLCDWEVLTTASIETAVVWNVDLCTFCVVYFTTLSVAHRS